MQQRYAELEDCYGFFCQCTRCQAEFDAPEEVSQLLDTILNKVGTAVSAVCSLECCAALDMCRWRAVHQRVKPHACLQA